MYIFLLFYFKMKNIEIKWGKKLLPPFFFQLADLDWGRLRVSVADRLTSGLSTKEDVLFKHLSPTCIIKHHRDSVLCSELGGGAQPTSNISPLL